jgi:hypothetical protein
MLRNVFYLSLVISLGLVACKKKDDPTEKVEESGPDQLTLNLIPQYDGQNYSLYDVIESPQGYRYKLTNIVILGTDARNGENSFAGSFMYNIENFGYTVFNTTGDPTKYSSMQFNVGVPYEINHADPSAHPSSSALNIANSSDMHWGWNPGYIFVKIEGMIDTLDDGQDNFDLALSYHMGTDDYFRTTTVDELKWTKGSDGKYFSNMIFDMNYFFENPSTAMNLKKEFFANSAPNQVNLCNRIMSNILNSIKAQ